MFKCLLSDIYYKEYPIFDKLLSRYNLINDSSTIKSSSSTEKKFSCVFIVNIIINSLAIRLNKYKFINVIVLII